MNIPFNRPLIFGSELKNIEKVLESQKLAGDGEFTKLCQNLIEEKFNAKKVMLTTSCTHALEIASFLINLKPGAEIICPSYTFVSSVNSFVLRGGTPKFIDIREDTLNLDETKIESAINDRTVAIMPVHYAGVGCEMDKINEIARKHDLYVIEDAAQGVNGKYKDRYLGTIGDLGTYSFHETKNYTCGEGGALILSNPQFIERAEIIREKGTDRSKFIRGEIDKYSWVDIGSSYLPSDILAAFLYCQLENMDEIKARRRQIFDYYYKHLKELEENDILSLPVIPEDCDSNYHMFYILLKTEKDRNLLIKNLKEKGIQTVFHYIPLHTAPMGLKFGYKEGDLPITESVSKQIIRLPLFYELKQEEQDYIIKEIKTNLMN
jgi:dTDP-4-amino-4,6-dideoxygalactose transaminase